MEIGESTVAGAILLAPHGRIDNDNARSFATCLLAAIGRGDTIIDFVDVAFITSAGLAALMAATKHARQSGRKLAVCRLQPVVQEVFQISRMSRVVKAHDTLEAALAALKA